MVGSFNQKAKAPSEEIQTRFHTAIEKGDEAAVTRLLSQHPDAIGWENSAGSNALDIALIYGQQNIGKWLIEKGADINHGDNDGWTPLIRAVDKNLPAMVQVLLGAGADIEKRITSSEMTPLLVAGMMGRTACAELLLKAGASPEAVDNCGKTALKWAERSGKAETAAAIRTFVEEEERKRQAEIAEKSALAAELDGMSTKGIDADLRVRKPLTLKT